MKKPLPRVDATDLFLVFILVACCGLSFRSTAISEWVYEQTDSPGLALVTLTACFVTWLTGVVFLSWKISMRGIRFYRRDHQ